MHHKRVLTALVVLPLVYLYVMYLPGEFYLLLLAFFCGIGLAEFYSIAGVRGALRHAGLLWGVALLCVSFFSPALLQHVFLTAVLAISSLRLFMKRDTSGSVKDVADTVLGLLYVPLLLSPQLSLIKSGPAWIILLYGAVWASDSMAYYIGKGFGRRRLYVEVSPNKTVAGAVGSVAGGIIGVIAVRAALLPGVPFPQAAVMGGAVGAATIVGDLVESMFKRDAGVKDSGVMIPGHGGVLDKLDGVLFAGPVFYWIGRVFHLVY